MVEWSNERDEMRRNGQILSYSDSGMVKGRGSQGIGSAVSEFLDRVPNEF